MIKKVRLTPKETIEATYLDGDGNEITFKGEGPAHPDFKHALEGLVPFFADLNQQSEPGDVKWSGTESFFNEELLDRYRVTAVIRTRAAGQDYVTLKGHKVLTRCGNAEITSPKLELNPQTCEWELLVPFEKALARLWAETEEYITLSHGKAAMGTGGPQIEEVKITYDIPDTAPSFVDD